MANEGSLSIQLAFPVDGNTVSRSLSGNFDKAVGNTYKSAVLAVNGSSGSRVQLLGGVTNPTLAVVRNTGSDAVKIYDAIVSGSLVGTVLPDQSFAMPIPGTGGLFAISDTASAGELEVIVPGE